MFALRVKGLAADEEKLEEIDFSRTVRLEGQDEILLYGLRHSVRVGFDCGPPAARDMTS